MLKKLFAGGQWVNAIVLAMNVLNQATGTFPPRRSQPDTS